MLLVPGPALLTWPWRQRRAPAAPPTDPSPLELWALPFVLAGSHSCGAQVGFVVAPGDALERDPVGSMGALLALLTLASAFVGALASVIVAKLTRFPPPRRPMLRLFGALVAGLLLGALAWTSEGDAPGIDFALLLLAPVALAWPWRKRKPAPD